MISKYFSALTALAISCATPAVAEVMTNQSVLALLKAGLGDDLVIAKINSERCNYTVSTTDILSLKNSGVSERVIAAMLTRCASASAARGIAGDDASPDPMVRHSPGIYVMEDWQKPAILLPVVASKSSGMKTSGNGSILLPLVVKMLLPGATSHLAVNSTSPTFYFYFNSNDQAVSDFGQEHSSAAQSPDGFSLVRLKTKKDTRELEMGRASSFDGSLVSYRKGLSLKSSVSFVAQNSRPGIYKVAVGPLQPGEYAFVFTGSDSSSRVYDFTVAASAMTRVSSR
ncbi:MAG: hypothetical protein NVS3B5_08480 [Sphingomicrobium sp.]